MEKRIILNSIKTPDGTILVSRHRHDYVTYTDESRLEFSVDGGNEYLKRSVGFNPKYAGLSEEEISYIKNSGIVYDPSTGRFFDKNYNLRDTAIDQDGYRHIFIINKTYKAHRLIFMFSGIKNIEEVDHRNNLRSDNRWINLRLVTKSQNQANSSIRKDSSTGIKGLSYNKSKEIWVGRVQFEGKRNEVSSKHKEICIEKLIALRSKLHGEFQNNGRDFETTKLNQFYEELSLYEDSPFEVIREHYCRGSRGKDGKSPLTWIPLKDMDDEYLLACIEYNMERGMKDCFANEMYAQELKYRQEKQLEDVQK